MITVYTAVIYSEGCTGDYYRGDDGEDSEQVIVSCTNYDDFYLDTVRQYTRMELNHKNPELVVFVNGVSKETWGDEYDNSIFQDLLTEALRIEKELGNKVAERKAEILNEKLNRERLERIAALKERERLQTIKDLTTLAELKAKYEV